jgi:hypothetical protein
MRSEFLRKILLSASFGACVFASATGCNETSDADLMDTDSELAGTDVLGAPILSAFEARLVRVGSNWVDKPSAFMDGNAIETQRTELQKAATGGSSTFAFVACEARGVNLETSSSKECAYLLNGAHGYSFDFVVRGFDQQLQKCAVLSDTCKPHQAIRIRAWNDGVQRPALFVEKRPLAIREATLLMVRPDIDTPQAAVAMTPGFQLDSELGARVASDLGFEGDSFVNLIHVSNKWSEHDSKLRLDRSRALAFGIVSIAFGGAQVGAGLTLLRGGATLTKVVRMLAVLDVAAGAASVIAGGVDVYGVRQLVQTLPPGSPTRTTLSAAVFIANIAPYLGGASVGSHLVRASSSALLRARSLQEMAKSRGVAVNALSKDTIARITGGADEAADEIMVMLLKGDREVASNRIKSFSDSVVARFESLKATPEHPWVPSGSSVETDILVKQGEQRGQFKTFVSGWSEIAGITQPPVGVRADLRTGYQEIIDFMHDSNRFYGRMQQLEAEVGKRIAAKGETSQQALEAILRAFETKNRFAPLQEIKVLTREIIEGGIPFRDLGFSQYQAHGQQVHRIQWNLILRELDAQPKTFGKIPGVEYYKEFASTNVEGMSWNKPWDDLFDSRGIKSPTCPERMRNVTPMLPILGNWE